MDKKTIKLTWSNALAVIRVDQSEDGARKEGSTHPKIHVSNHRQQGVSFFILFPFYLARVY